ncbi:hypothetical protein HZH68_002179 [Vespula germanica]|uniref:Uncharacterized protein n=1 Tax=Vespula germanica TaxID=30212 RepID=A0A834NLJ0_VESGE|nr:hypothetical protein HZH68_002179 [Vespula germanica]
MASFNLTNREATSHLFYPLGESRKQEAALSPPTIHASSIVGYLRCNEGFLLLPLKGVHCQSMLHGSSGKNGGDSSYQQNSLEDSSRSGPYFDKSASKNVTALLGKTTYLNCRVKNLGNKTGSELCGVLTSRVEKLLIKEQTVF